jgi:hypothetical protein
MVPDTPTKRNAFFTEYKDSRTQLEAFRKNRYDLISDYCGDLYADTRGRGNRAKVVANMMNQTATIYTMALAATRPRVLVNTPHSQLKAFSRRFQLAINNLTKEIHLEETLQRCVLDAFFGVGIAKVYMADAGEIEIESGEWIDPGKPFVEAISLDNFNFDMTASRWEDVAWAADEYVMDTDALMEYPGIDKDLVKRGAGMRSDYPQGRDGETAAREITQSDSNSKSYKNKIQVKDVYFPEANKICTWIIDFESKPLIERKWDGPEQGPYRILSLVDVPDNIMPSAPGSHLKHNYDLINLLLRKQHNQAVRQKDIPIYSGDGKDPQRLKRANDGEWTRVANVQDIDLLKMGGVDGGNMAFRLAMTDLADRMAGNMKLKAGLGPQSDTATQDQMLSSQVSAHEAKMQDRVTKFAGAICGDLGHLMYHDKMLEVPGEMAVPSGSDFMVDASWTPEMREGNFLQYNFDVEPYSMSYKSPGERADALIGVLTNVFGNQMVFESMMQQGGSLDVQEITEQLSELLDMPRLKDVIIFQTPANEERPGPAGDDGTPKMAANTTRTNIRKSVSTGGTEEGRSHAMQQALLGVDQGASQVAGPMQ